MHEVVPAMTVRARRGLGTTAAGALCVVALCSSGGCSTVLGIGDWTNLTDGGSAGSTTPGLLNMDGSGAGSEGGGPGSADGPDASAFVARGAEAGEDAPEDT